MILYIFWLLVPLSLFGIGVWTKLESFSKKTRQQNSADFFKQGAFVLLCWLVAFLIDKYAIEDIVTAVSPDFIPLGFYRALLFPLILLFAAKVLGPSKEIRIQTRKLGSRSQSGRS